MQLVLLKQHKLDLEGETQGAGPRELSSLGTISEMATYVVNCT